MGLGHSKLRRCVSRFLFLDEAHAQKYAAFFRLRTAAERQRAMPGGGPPYL
jgi:hypothetical protein